MKLIHRENVVVDPIIQCDGYAVLRCINVANVAELKTWDTHSPIYNRRCANEDVFRVYFRCKTFSRRVFFDYDMKMRGEKEDDDDDDDDEDGDVARMLPMMVMMRKMRGFRENEREKRREKKRERERERQTIGNVIH